MLGASVSAVHCLVETWSGDWSSYGVGSKRCVRCDLVCWLGMSRCLVLVSLAAAAFTFKYLDACACAESAGSFVNFLFVFVLSSSVPANRAARRQAVCRTACTGTVSAS
jgi:hypothetical protein